MYWQKTAAGEDQARNILGQLGDFEFKDPPSGLQYKALRHKKRVKQTPSNILLI